MTCPIQIDPSLKCPRCRCAVRSEICIVCDGDGTAPLYPGGQCPNCRGDGRTHVCVRCEARLDRDGKLIRHGEPGGIPKFR